MGSLIGVQKVAAKKIGIDFDQYILKIENEKWCTKCKSWKPKSIFNTDNSRSDNLTTKCRDCIRVNRPHKSHKGRVSTFKGMVHSEKTKKIISEKNSGKKSPMKGKKHSVEAKIKISKALRINGAKGDKCHSYKDGKMEERIGIRRSGNYKRWRFDVFSRDKFTCQKCGDNKGGNLNAHHIKPFAHYPENRFDVDNGITLCEACHKKEHKKN